jgi:carbonic anhydrase
MRSLLKYSDMLRDEVDKGNVQIQGAIYDIMTGEVEFLGPLPQSVMTLS